MPRTPRFQGRVITFCSKVRLERARRCSDGVELCVRNQESRRRGAPGLPLSSAESSSLAHSVREVKRDSLFSLKSMRINSIFKGTHGVKRFNVPLRSHSSFHLRLIYSEVDGKTQMAVFMYWFDPALC